MSEENLELAQRFFDAVARAMASYWRSPGSIAEAIADGDLTPEAKQAFEFLHPEIVWNAGGFGTFQGHAQMAGAWDDILDVTEHYTVTVRELRDGMGDLVYAAVDRRLEAKGSGLKTDFPVFAVFRFEDGLITRLDEYTDRHEALEAAGLQE